MLTRFTTNQCDHYWWYLCMGTNNSLSLQESWYRVSLPPLVLQARADPRGSCLQDYFFLLSSPSLSFSTFSHFTHLPRANTNRNGVLSLCNCHSNIARPPDANPSKLQYSQAAWCLGTNLRVYRTAFAWSQLQRKVSQWQRASRRRSTALETQEKTTETEARS